MRLGATQYIPRRPAEPWRNPYRDVRLYEVDAATLSVVRSVSVEKNTPGYGSEIDRYFDWGLPSNSISNAIQLGTAELRDRELRKNADRW